MALGFRALRYKVFQSKDSGLQDLSGFKGSRCTGS